MVRIAERKASRQLPSLQLRISPTNTRLKLAYQLSYMVKALGKTERVVNLKRKKDIFFQKTLCFRNPFEIPGKGGNLVKLVKQRGH